MSDIKCKYCKYYGFESGPPDYCPSNYGSVYCEKLHGNTRAFSEEESRIIDKNGVADNCPLKGKIKS